MSLFTTNNYTLMLCFFAGCLILSVINLFN